MKAFKLPAYFWFAVFLLIFLVSIWYTNSGPVRWAEDLCHWKTIHYQKGEVDLAFFGSSRSRRAFEAEIYNQQQKVRGIDPGVVYDFSRSQRGLGHTYVLMKEFLKTREVRQIIVEFNSTHSRTYHDLFYLKADIPTLLQEIRSEPHRPFLERFSNFFLTLAKRFSKRWEQTFRGGFFRFPGGPAKPARTTDCGTGVRGTEPSVLIQFENNNADKFFTEGRVWELDDAEEIRNDFYTRKIVELARQYEIPIVFVHVVGRYSTRLDPEMIAAFESRYGAKILQPESEVLADWFNQNAYYDPSHMNLHGARLFADWLIEVL